MFLAFDVGNTNITVGCFKDEEIHRTWRISTIEQVT
ncbi:type III pantothenate kinase, partial [Candidatus Bipolaricaulota bacterium]|nr:type III pantothenate kinase [Candidatus Bipolaricaulota bacterium]